MDQDENALAEALADVGDVGDIKLELTKAEKLNTIALMMGIQFYTKIIISDPNYLKLMIDREKEMRLNNANPAEALLWHLRPANVEGVIKAATMFLQFLMGDPSRVASVQYEDGTKFEAGDGRSFINEAGSNK